ncbi:nonribosomal peptide synthetase [Diaporthe amygdali]|uniref:nonribosomal peptide synthetase n=1 Tax=Phomopsis amygdali TaxID=1214568 RepID=UPI0022FDB40F|nr:nonribosomal peptide synthetase [Diaporthe amygdali]KAJ0123869.1 nonribosomal peptide synthetase [Diaporthe amygdali]
MGSVANLSSTPYGRRLLPTLIDEVSSQDPDRECFQIPRSSEPSDGWRILTWKDMANAVNRCAHRIIELCGTPEKDSFPVIAYLGPNDVRYIVLMIAAVKAGYTAMFISPRNSKEGQLNLFDKTSCNILAFASSHKETVKPWLAERDMQAVEVSDLDAWFPEKEVPHFPYTKTFDEAEWDPFLVLHTSGSTGLPKPIIVRQGMWNVNDGFHNLPLWQGKKVAMPGLLCVVGMSMFWDTPVCLGIAERPLSSDLVVECLEKLDVQSTLLPPALIEDLSQSEEGLKSLTKLNVVAFGGGNLAREAGNRLVKQGTALMNLIGATEFAPFPTYARGDPALWQYFIYNPEAMGCEFRKQGDEEVYEMVVVRQKQNQHPHPGLQGIFYTFPELNEWSTRDLYRPHPTKPHHWIYHGRADNIIVFSNGEKLNPVTIEEIVSDHNSLKGAMVVGSEKFQAGLIVEPRVHPKTKEEEKALLDSVWPLVEKANEETVTHGRISRDLITLSNPEKPFLRAGKGTIQRAVTVKLYKDEINKLYENFGTDEHAKDVVELDLESEETLARSIVETLRKYIGAERLEEDVDFFAAGVDSMGVMRASKLFRAGLKDAGREVNDKAVAPKVIYQNATPRRLAAYILGNVLNGQGQALSEDEQQQQAMRAIWKKYTQNLIKAQPNRPDPSNESQTVILTGSTGMLGSYLLDFMARNSRIAKIICLNRAGDGGRAQQSRAFADRGLDTSTLATKAEFHHADLSKPKLGLPEEVYARLQAETDRVIHNAWPVNFNIPIESFEPSLAGVRNIADLAATAARRLAVTFISSIAVADRWDAATHGAAKVPEQRLEDLALPNGGYGRSKAVGSLIIEDAAAKGAGDFPHAIVRVGQVAGPEAEAGVWNRQEWLPSIIASSLYLGALPANLGAMNRVDWTPAERIAKLVLEATGVSRVVEKADEISGYYHGVNPHESDWKDLAAAVQDFYGKERIRELISFGEWVDRLEKTQADGSESVARNPGVKLVDSYRDMAQAPGSVVYDMEKTLERCLVVRETSAITPDMMKHWCRQWGF